VRDNITGLLLGARCVLTIDRHFNASILPQLIVVSGYHGGWVARVDSAVCASGSVFWHHGEVWQYHGIFTW